MNYWDNLMGTDEGAAHYMESYGEGPGSETRHLVGRFINDGESVLDVGCGPGWNLDHFMQYGPKTGQYLGLDYSERFVRIAKKRWETKAYVFLGAVGDFDNNELFQVGDCRDLRQPDSSWDVVILQDVLEHTNGYEKPIQEALRVARKRVIVTMWRTMREEGDGDQINDDGDDGYGATYEYAKFAKYLDGLNLHWLELETSEKANRYHRYFIIDKEAQHG